MPCDGESNRRLVLRAYKTNAILKANAATPIFLVSLTQESLRKSLRAYVIPTLLAADPAQVAGFESGMLLPAETARVVIEQRPDMRRRGASGHPAMRPNCQLYERRPLGHIPAKFRKLRQDREWIF